MLARHAETKYEAHETDGGNDNHGKLPTGGIAAIHGAEPVAQRFPSPQSDEATAVGKEHTIGRENGLCIRIVRHHTQHGTVGYVDACVYGHHQDIGDVSPDELARPPHLRCGKEQDAGYGKWQCNPKQIGAVLAPAGMRTVGYDTHHGIGNRVPDAGDQHQQTCICQAQAENIGIEEGKVIREYLPKHRR